MRRFAPLMLIDSTVLSAGITAVGLWYRYNLADWQSNAVRFTTLPLRQQIIIVSVATALLGVGGLIACWASRLGHKSFFRNAIASAVPMVLFGIAGCQGRDSWAHGFHEMFDEFNSFTYYFYICPPVAIIYGAVGVWLQSSNGRSPKKANSTSSIMG